MTIVPDPLNEFQEATKEPNAVPFAVEDAFLRWVERLENLIEIETAALSSGEPFDLGGLNCKKNHALLELMLVSNSVSGKLSPIAATRLGALRVKLKKNAETLEQYLRALSEISELMIKSIQADGSDGTYTRRRLACR